MVEATDVLAFFRHRWSDALTGTLAGASPESRRFELLEMAGFFQQLIPRRLSCPTSDLVGAVAMPVRLHA